MKHLALDSSIYRQAPQLDSPEFKTLSYLCRKGCAMVHVPYVIEREFSTQLEQFQRQRISDATKALRRAVNFSPLGQKSKELIPMLGFLEQEADELVLERSSAFLEWIQNVGAERHSLSMAETIGALEAYFSGGLPLKEPKVRKDIPDSFIFQCVTALYKKYGDEFAVVVEDEALLKAYVASNIAVYPSLSAFLDSAEAQECLADKIIDDNLDDVLHRVEQIAQEHEQAIVDAIEAELQRDVGAIYGDDLPGESAEIYVSGVGEPDSITIEEFEHMGAGVFVGKFSGKVEFIYEYAVYISEAIDLDPEKFHIEPLNDHYVNVETTDEFEFTGRLELDFGEGILGYTNAAELIAALENPSISADELEDFHLADEHE